MGVGLAAGGYLADEGLSTAVYLSLALRRPLLLEGEAGVGKTEVARVLAGWSEAPLVRLQCWEGIDATQAVYEWDYPRQLLHLRTVEAARGDVAAGDVDAEALEVELYDERFLLRRPLLQAISATDGPPVLLIDEVDRADDEFEAYLLEVLADYAVTVPELGTIRAVHPPMVVLTSNRTRDVHDALKRRCLYHWVEHPDFDREVEIVRLRHPAASEQLARQVAALAAELRSRGLYKPPGVAETLDWVEAILTLRRDELSAEVVEATLGAALKYREDQERVRNAGTRDLVDDALRRSG